MKTKESYISNLKSKILADAISFVDIIDVDIKSPDENQIHLYIKTNNLNTVDSDKLIDLCNKYSNKELIVEFQIPTHKIRGDNNLVNSDLVCVFIKKIIPFGLEPLVAF